MLNTPSNPTVPTPTSRTGRRMAVAGALLTGGMVIGSLFSPLGLAGAQDSDGTVTDSESIGERSGQGRHGHRDPEFLQELLGVSADDLRQARADGKTLAEFAAEQGVNVDDLVSAMVDQAADRIAEAVESGDLDPERAATITENLEERITERVNRTPGERGRFGHRGLDASVLTDLGLDVEALREAMSEGSTLAEAAAAQGVSEADLVTALVDGAEVRLAEAVENGRLDADRAAEIEAGIAERIQDRVDGERPEGHGRRGGPRGGGPLAQDSSFES